MLHLNQPQLKSILQLQIEILGHSLYPQLPYHHLVQFQLLPQNQHLLLLLKLLTQQLILADISDHLTTTSKCGGKGRSIGSYKGGSI